MASLQDLTVALTSTFTGDVTIVGGTINGTSIGNNVAQRSTIGATTIDGTTITASTKFIGDLEGDITATAISASGASSFGSISTTGATVIGTNLTATGGTSTFSLVDINGGNIDGTAIGVDAGNRQTIGATTIDGTTITASLGFSGNITGPTGGTVGTSTLNNLNLNGDLTVSSGELVFGATTVIDSSRNIFVNDLNVAGAFSPNALAVTTTGTFGGNLTVGGDLTVNGTTTTINTETIALADSVIELNSDLDGGTAPSNNAGISINRGSATDVTFVWDEANDYWTFGSNDVVATNFIGNVSGNITGDITGDVTGNADTATRLETTRTIELSGDVAGSVSFDGAADVNIATVIQANSVALGTDTVGQFASTLAVTGNGLSATQPNASDGTAYTISSNATPANTPSTLVFRDSSGDFAASSITANTFIGNINSTAGNDTLASLTVGGTLAVTGTTTFNDAVTVATGVALNSDTVGITGGSILNTPIGNLTGGAQSIVGTTVQATGGFTGNLVGNVTGNVTGNADTADGLSSAVTVDLTGPVTGTATFQDGGDTATIATTIENNTVTLGTQTVGQYASTVAVSGVGLSITAPSADDGTAYIITSNATASNNQDTIVSRDANGDFNAGTITADLVGAVTGDVTGNISATVGSSTLNNLSVTGTGTIDTVSIAGGNINGTIIGNSTPAAGNFTTISATGNISALAGVTGNLAGNVTAVSGTSQFSTLNVTGDMSATSGTTTLNDLVVQGNLDFTDLSISGSLTIGANLTVAGDVNIADTFIVLNSDLANDTSASEDVGFTVNRGSDNDVSFFWDESLGRWSTGNDSLQVNGTIFGNLDGAIGTTTPASGSFTTVTTSGNLIVGNNLTVAGDLEVQGSVTTVNTEQIELADNIIRVNSNATAGATGGLEVWRGTDGVRRFIWDEDAGTAGRFSTDTADLEFGTAFGNFIGNVTVGSGQTIDISAATLTLADDQISGDKISGGTIGTVTVSNLTSSNATITGGSIDSTPIGVTTPALITGTTITADTQFVGDLDGNVSGNLTGDVTSTGTSTFAIAEFNAGVTFNGDIQGANGTTATFDDLVVTGTTNLQVFQIGDFSASGTVTFDEPFVTVNKGATGVDTANAGIEVERGDSPNVQLFWDGTNTRWSVDTQDFEAEKFIGDIVSTGTNSSFNTVDINGGTIDNTVIGASTRAAGNFTEIDANAGITGSFDGPVTSSSVTITGGTINSTQIGNTSPSSGNFTTVTASGNITTATGEVTADIITATGSLVGDLTGTVSSIGNHTTADLAEDPTATATSGTQYFTTTRVDAHLSGGTGVTYTNGTISIGQPVATTDNVTFNNVNVDGDLTVVGAIDVPNLTVTGDLTVNGNTTTLNTETIELEDSIITLSNGYVGSTPSANAGININRGGGSAVDVQLLWNETTDKWEAIGGAFVSNSGFEGNIIGNVTGNVTATGGVSSFNSVDIDGGSIDGTAIGQNNPSTGVFQSVTASGNIAALTFSGNLTGNVTGTVSSIANHNTTTLAEGDNLYYTDARVDAHLSGANSVTYTNGVISIPQSIETTSDVTFNNVTVDGLLTAPNYAFTNIDAAGNVTVSGNLTVGGDTATFNTAVEISTSEVKLNSAYTGNTPTSNAAIIVNRDLAGDAKLEWDENNDRWDIGSGATFRAGILLGNLTGDVTSNSTSTFADIDINAGSIDGVVIGVDSPGLITGTTVTATTRFQGPITGDVTGNVNGDVTGNITSAALSTFADIDVNGGNIDGTAIGESTPALGNFTTINASGTVTANSGVVGNLTGNVTGDVTGDVTGNVTAGSGTSTFNNVTINGTLSAPAQSITDLTVAGNLTVNGTTTTINSETIELADNIIVLNSDKTGAAGSETAGIQVNRGTDAPVTFIWNDATDRWTIGSGTLEAGEFLGSVTGPVTGPVTGNVTGNITSAGVSTFANAVINGGTIDDTDIGGVNPSTGVFTTLNASSIVAGTITANTEFLGSFDGDGSRITGITTTQITEGSKLFFTNGRVQSALGSISIDALSDIDVSSSLPSDGDTLVWNAGISKFVPAENFLQSDFDTAIGTTSIDNLSDVDTTTIPPNNGDTLVYNSTSSKWQPSTGQTSFSVTASGTSAWLFSGQGTDSDANPDLYLLPGKTYTFDIDATGTSFYINTSNTTGTGSAFNDGVTNNGTDSGVITFTVPQDAPSELFYNAENQAAMNGKIFVLKGTLNNVENPVFTSVKSSAYYDSQDRQLVIKDSSGNVIWGN